MKFSIKCIQSYDKIKDYKDEWIELEKKYPNESYNYNLIDIWLSHFINYNNDRFGYNKKIHIILLYKNNSLVSIFPLINLTRKFKRIVSYNSLELIGQQYGLNNLGVLGEVCDEHIDLYIKWIRKNIKFDIMTLQYQNDKNSSYFKSFNKIISSGFPVIQLTDFIDYNDYNKQQYNSKKRYNIKSRKKSFLKNNGELIKTSYENISNDDFNGILDVSASKKTEGKHNHFDSKEILDYTKSMLSNYKNQIVLAKINNKVIGYQMSFLYSDFRLYSGLSYDRNYKKYGIGNLIDDFEIESQDFNSIKFINMGAGLDSYKLIFCSGIDKLYTFQLKGNTWLSFILHRIFNKRFRRIEKLLQAQILNKNL